VGKSLEFLLVSQQHAAIMQYLWTRRLAHGPLGRRGYGKKPKWCDQESEVNNQIHREQRSALFGTTTADEEVMVTMRFAGRSCRAGKGTSGDVLGHFGSVRVPVMTFDNNQSMKGWALRRKGEGRSRPSAAD
jgi:hypothetical protein